MLDPLQEIMMESCLQYPKIKMLLIEDDKGFARFIHEILNKAETITFDIQDAARLDTGLEYLANTAFAVILLDLNLPDSEGLDTFIRLYTEIQEIPIVILTGLSDETLANQALKIGAQDYLVKTDINRDLLIRSLRYAIERHGLRIEQKLTEKALRESEKKYRELVENLNEGIWIIDKDSKTTFTNQIMANILGYTPEEMTEKQLFSYMDIDSLTICSDKIENSKQGVSGQYESKFIRKDGTALYTTVMLSPLLDDDGKYKGIVFCVADITRLKHMEIALKKEKSMLARKVADQTAELRNANFELMRSDRLKDEFLANMSHELRTPLTSILGMSEALQKNVYGMLNEKQLQCLQLIKDKGDHLLNLINDILDITRINSGKLELEIQDIIISSICHASLQFIMQEARKKKLDVITNIDSSASVMQGDAIRLKQMLVNLLSNAVKFTPNGGKIGLEVKGDIENQIIHFNVWDTGIGIRQEDIGNLFKPFTQLNGSLSRQYTGTGLGLALISKIAELHNGKISVESELNVGSRFTISLPWRVSISPMKSSEISQTTDLMEVLSIPLTQSQKSETTGSLIILVEDDESITKIISDFLSHVGYQIISIKDGRDVIEKLKDKRPDLVLMDISLPGINGFDLIRIVRSDDVLSNMPIIALTGLAMQGDRERCILAGANDYMSKPIKLDILLKSIDTQLKRIKE
jgi:PAS domain S-box-containing protein